MKPICGICGAQILCSEHKCPPKLVAIDRLAKLIKEVQQVSEKSINRVEKHYKQNGMCESVHYDLWLNQFKATAYDWEHKTIKSAVRRYLKETKRPR